MRTRICGISSAAVVALLFAACGGPSNSGTSTPSSPTPPTGGGSADTITIANGAVSPKNLTIARGSQVTFINNDSQSHEMASDPHPIHTDCPEINAVGVLNPGQSRRTGTFNTARTCGYHDHTRDTVQSLQGTITIQ